MSVSAETMHTLAGISADTVRALSASRNEPEWMLQKRLDAFAIYESTPMPSRTDEEWRRTSLRTLKLDRYQVETDVAPRAESLEAVISGSEHQLQFGTADQRSGISVVSDHGTVWHEAADLPEGVIFAELNDAVQNHPELVREYFMTKAVPADFGKFEALHAALWQSGTFLYVPENVTVEHPFRSFVTQPTVGSSLFNHSVVVVEKNAEAFFVDAFQSDTAEGTSFTSEVVELFLADDARLRYVQVQDWGRHVHNFMTQRAILGTDSELKSLEVTLGSKFTKNSIGSHLRGENGLAEMLGIYFGDSKQFFDHHTWQLHESPYNTSDLEFKGALKDGARSVYSGLIKVEEGAQKTDAFQQNRNLVLDRTARADSIPNLEIEANDVRCTHGATVSQVEEEHLFYLQARGIPRSEAQKLVVEGFFRPVIDRIPVEEIQDFLQTAIARKVGY